MEKAIRRRYTLEYKQEAVRLVASGHRVSAAAKALGIVEQTLANWVKAGTITFYDGGVTLGSVNVAASGNAVFTISSLTFGSHTLTAVYSGDANHTPSTSSAVSELIVQSAAGTLISNLDPSIAGTAVTFTMKLTAVNGVVPSGSIVFTDGTNSIGTATLDATGTATLQTSSLSVATHIIAANYAGDKNYSVTSATLTQTVQNANTQVMLTSSASPATYQTPVVLTATVTSNGGVATGDVTFTDGGVSIGTSLLNPSGVAALSLSSLAPGTHSIVANYAGDGKASASVSSPLIVVVKATTSISIASDTNPTQTLTSIDLTATVKNGDTGAITGSVVFSDGSTQLGSVPVGANGVAALSVSSLAAGSHSIIASYLGDGDNFSSISAPMVQNISLRPTSTTLTATEANSNNTQQVTLISVERWTDTTVPTGTVTFMNGSAVIGSSPIDGTGVATLTIVLESPTGNFTASYSGDTVYAGSASASVAVTSGQPVDFSMTLNPSSISLASGQHGTTTLTLTSIQPFTDTLQLGCDGLPTAASCTFTTTEAKLASGDTTTVKITVDTGDPLGSGAESASIHGHPNGTMLCFLPVGFLAGLAMFRKRRRSALGLLVVFCAILLSLGTTGCGGLSVNGTPAGSYTFKVTAVGQQSGVSVAQVMSLTVTK